MKYYLCIVGSFQDGGEENIKDDCLTRNVYQYYRTTRQKGAGASIDSGDTLIFIYKKEILAYGVADGKIGSATGYENDPLWEAVKIRGSWQCTLSPITLPYGVYWHTLQGNMQSVVKEIDALWANELLLPLLPKDTKENVVSLHVPTIVAFFKNGFLSIPALQRGKVWNAVRVEILWDSLLRNIPIGSLSFKPEEDEKRMTWALMDGQQRVNALALGYTPFPSEAENDKRDSILWIDLGINNEEIEQSDGASRKSARRFFFRVTTPAHPWGYALSDNETRNTPLSASEIRKSLDAIRWNEKCEKKGEKPAPRELWPYDAKFPVPFSILRSYCETTNKPIFEDFWKSCRRAHKECNWFKHFDNDEKTFDISAIAGALQKLDDIRIPLQNAIGVPDEDVGLYFARMNKAGIVPNTEEIQYSLLKAKLPELKNLDNLAEGRMQPARLASIAMLAYLTTKDNQWVSQVTNTNISELATDDEFKSYIGENLKGYLEDIDKALVYKETENSFGVPRVLVSKLALSTPDIYRLFIVLKRKCINIEPKILVAIATLVSWFGNDYAQIAQSGFKHLVNTKNMQQPSAIQEWLFEAIQKGWMLIPPPCRVFEAICEAKDINSIEKAWNPPGYRDAINRIWRWTSIQGRGLLLYVVRKYLQKYFGNYDPADAVWNEENCPWDYDHIFPQAWLKGRSAPGNVKWHNLVAEFLNSIGNIAPLPFSVNRGKGENAPDEYQGKDNELLLIQQKNNEEFFGYNGKGELEAEQNALLFAKITATRLQEIYASWYTELEIGELLKFSNHSDPRHDLFIKVQQGHPGAKIYYPVESGCQNELVQLSSDWARPWLACGIIFKNIDTGNGKNEDCLISIASDGTDFEIGLRRHPTQEKIDGDSNHWYYKDPKIMSLKNKDTTVDAILVRYKELLDSYKNNDEEG